MIYSPLQSAQRETQTVYEPQEKLRARTNRYDVGLRSAGAEGAQARLRRPKLLLARAADAGARHVRVTCRAGERQPGKTDDRERSPGAGGLPRAHSAALRRRPAWG